MKIPLDILCKVCEYVLEEKQMDSLTLWNKMLEDAKFGQYILATTEVRAVTFARYILSESSEFDGVASQFILSAHRISDIQIGQ